MNVSLTLISVTTTCVLIGLLTHVDARLTTRKCENHRSCSAFEKRKIVYCSHEWVTENCREMCGLCVPDCVDHRICRVYEVGKKYYCRHNWIADNCKKMCGMCTPQCQEPDHDACSNYLRRPNFYCPHPWLKKHCNRMCGRCTENSGPRWPHGEYGILSREKCPPQWYEFTHCMDTDNEGKIGALTTDNFRLSPVKNCDRTSVSFRYCFKGPLVPTRPGGFWTNFRYNGFAYVVRNVVGDCEEFGSDGGIVEIDNEDENNKNMWGNNGLNGKRYEKYHPFDFVFMPYDRTRLSFCKVGEKGSPKSPSYIEVGKFGDRQQKFGFFVKPGHACPTVRSPYGIIHGTVQDFYTDDEKYMGKSKVLSGKPPVVINRLRSRTGWSVCQYNPAKAKRFTIKKKK